MKVGIIYALIGVFLLGSCSEQKKNDVIKNSVELLKENIRLDSINPQSAKWIKFQVGKENSRIPGPTDYRLIAILTLSDADFQRIKDQHKTVDDVRDQIHLESDFVRDWFTPSVKENFSLEDGYYRVNTEVYPATVFSQSPLLHGIFFLSKKNEVFIMMYTM